MSTAHAIAAVTQVLVSVIDETMKAANVPGIVGSDVVVSALSPARVDLSQASDPNQLNLFLYLALPNHGGSGIDLPTRDASGARVRTTPLALDLYYLVTAYGADDGFAEIVLGHAMQALHENPILPRDAIRAKLKPGVNPSNAQLAVAAAGLADQVEQIKVSPEKLSTEEISRLWSALGAEYRPSVAYRVTVVLIEARASTKTSLPVLQRGVYLRQLRTPVIERLAVKAAPDAPALENQPILPGALVVVGGKRLLGEITRIVIDGVTVEDADAFLSPENVGFTLPATLRAGPHGAQIVHQLALGSPPVPHAGTGSNVVPFLLRPVVVGAVTATATKIKVKVRPPVTHQQKVRLLLNQRDPAPDAEALAFSFGAPAQNGIDVAGGATETDTIAFPYADVPPGAYLARVQVEGAESVLQVDPVTGAYAKPSVNVP
jgi:hypothetical protein